MEESPSLDQLTKEKLVERCLHLQKRLEEQKATTTSWIEALTTVAFTDQDMAKAMTRGLQTILKSANMDGGYVHLLDQTDHKLRLRACVGLSKAAQKDLEVIRQGERVPGKVLHKAKALIARNSSEISDPSGETPQEEKRLLHAGFPLKWNGRVLGTLTLVSKNHKTLSEGDVATLRAFSKFIAGVVQCLTLLDILSQGKRQWENAIDSVSDIVLICDRDFRIVRTNKAIFDRFWFPLEDALGKECFKLLYNGNPFQVSRQKLERMLREGITYCEEVAPSRWGGTFSIVISPILTFGTLAGSIHVIKEITQERLLETDRGELARRLSLFAPGTITTDPEGRIHSCDAGASEILGYEAEEIKGKELTAILPSLESKTLFDRLQKSGGILDFDATAMGKGQHPVQVSLTLSANGDQDERLEEVTLFIRDMTERQSDKVRYVQSVRLTALMEMAANVSHKLGGELETIISHIYRIDDSGCELPEMKTRLKRVAVHARSVQETLDRLHQFSEIHPEEESKVLESTQLIRSVVEMIEGRWQTSFRKRGIDFKFNPDQRILPSIQGNLRELLQLFDHLVRNAVAAMPKGGNLILRTRTDRKWISLSLIDHGMGMTEDQINRAFDPFFTTHEENLGLGLSIVHGIIRRHHGDVAIQSRVGQGTSVTIKLPTLNEESIDISTNPPPETA